MRIRSMELKLEQEIYKLYQEKDGTELTVKQVEDKARDIFDYWVHENLPDLISEGLI